MKKLFFTFVLSAICGGAFAQTVSVSDIEIKAGQKAAFTFVVNVGDNEFTGIECSKWILPEGLTISSTAVAEGWDKEAYNDTGDNTDGSHKFAFTSTKDVAIPKNQNIALGSIELEASSTLTFGTVLTVTIPAGEIKFVPGSTPFDQEISFNVTVTDYITLDENSVVIPNTVSTASNVKVLRTIKGGEWSTISLPFEMTADEVKAKFGNNSKLASINGYNVEKEGGEIVEIEVLFKNVNGKLVKNRPYILYVEDDINGFEIENKTIDPKETTYTPVDDDEDNLPTSMTGCMKAGTLVPAKSLFLSDNKFWYSTGNTKMKAFRAYFTFEENLSSVASSRIKFSLSDGDTQTEIQIPELMPNDGEYYDLKGQRVETPSKGVYIKDGKKVVVK